MNSTYESADRDPRADNRHLGSHGVAFVDELVRRPQKQGGFGGFFRRIPQEDDRGVDGHIEFRETVDGWPMVGPGKLLGVQVRSSERLPKAGDLRGSVSEDVYQYWLSHSVPVLLVLVDREARQAFWVRGDVGGHEHVNGSIRIVVPRANAFNADAIWELARIAANVTPSSIRLALLESYITWMKRLAAGERICVSVYDWLDRDYVRRDISIGPLQTSGSIRVEQEIYSASDEMLLELLRGEFPWADVQLDEQSHKEGLHEWFKGHHRGADESEYEEWAADFRERKGEWLDNELVYPMLIDDDGALYYFTLRLNDLGRSFLCLYSYLHG
ncbi:MAG TPA: DUF4365 domain-containing protein [Longimicrobium sp.]|nr:DUF4365 domain-containing protein [Longimicrobium sp.]